MVDESLDADTVTLIEPYSHQKCLQWPVSLQRPTQTPADDVAAVTICQERQVEESLTTAYIGYIGDSHLTAGF